MLPPKSSGTNKRFDGQAGAGGRAFADERIPRATAWRLAFLAIQGGGSVVLFSSLGHVLGREAFAATAVAQGVIVLAQAIGDFGFSQAAVTVLPARIAARPREEADLLAGASFVYLAAAPLGLLLTLLAVPLVPTAAALPVAVSAPAAAASVIVAGADGLLRSRAEFRRPVVLMSLSEGAGFAGLPVAILTHSAVWTCAAVSAGMSLGALASVVTLLRIRRRGSTASTMSFARASLPLGLSQVFIALATRADTLLAGAFSGLIAAGTFEGSWRVYQLSQYLAGGVATAAAPFVADALGAGRYEQALGLLRKLIARLFAIGVLAGAVMYVARVPIARLLTGSLAGPVADSLLPFAVVSPLSAVALVGYYTLIGRDGQRRYVLGSIVVGAVVNVVLVITLAPSMGARGAVVGCAVGLTVINVLLLARLVIVMRVIGAQANGRHPPAAVARLPQRSE